MNTKYELGQQVTWKDANRRFVGTIVEVYEETATLPASYIMIIKDITRKFARYEPELKRI